MAELRSFPWCRVVQQPVPSEAKPQPDGTARAAMLPSTPLWPRGKPIRVHLLNDAVDSNGDKVEKSKLLAPNKWNIKEDQIFKWAGRWKFGSIPKFEKSENPDNADILVQLNDHVKVSDAKVGKVNSEKEKGQPTMRLKFEPPFKEGADNYNQHVVVHEFGHILGLEHEHERSDFWENIEKFLDKATMMKSEEGNLYQLNKKLATSESSESSEYPYDPDSVMHYPFNREWLKLRYRNEDEVEQMKDITESQKRVLLGILYRCERESQYSIQPSKADLTYLNRKYKARESNDCVVSGTCNPALNKGGSKAIKEDPPKLNLKSLTCIERGGKKVEIMMNVASKWKDFGIQLNFDDTGSLLNTIEDNQRRDPSKSCQEMFQHWLGGKGTVELSWSSVIQILHDIGLTVLAEKVKDIVQ